MMELPELPDINLPDPGSINPEDLLKLDGLSDGLKCADNASIGAFNDAIADASNQINDVLGDINGKIDDAIGQLEGKIAEAEGALNDALGQFEAKVPNIKDEVAEAMQMAVNPLAGPNAIADKIQSIKDRYGDAVDDVDELIGKISGFIENPVGSIDSLCDDLPNIELTPDGLPVVRQPESLEPGAATEIKIELPIIPEVTTAREKADEPVTTIADNPPNLEPATTSSGSVTVADLTTGAVAFPYPAPTRGSEVWGESLDQLNRNLELLASEVMSPIKDLYPDLVITHGFRSEYVELRGGSYVPRRNPGTSDHYRGCACDFQFADVSSREELIRRAETIRNRVPKFRQFILEYPQTFSNQNFLIHISFRENDNPREVFTSLMRDGRRVREEEFV